MHQNHPEIHKSDNQHFEAMNIHNPLVVSIENSAVSITMETHGFTMTVIHHLALLASLGAAGEWLG